MSGRPKAITAPRQGCTHARMRAAAPRAPRPAGRPVGFAGWQLLATAGSGLQWGWLLPRGRCWWKGWYRQCFASMQQSTIPFEAQITSGMCRMRYVGSRKDGTLLHGVHRVDSTRCASRRHAATEWENIRNTGYGGSVDRPDRMRMRRGLSHFRIGTRPDTARGLHAGLQLLPKAPPAPPPAECLP